MSRLTACSNHRHVQSSVVLVIVWPGLSPMDHFSHNCNGGRNPRSALQNVYLVIDIFCKASSQYVLILCKSFSLLMCL